MASGAALSRSLVTLGRVDRAALVVELGSGTGVVTRHILESCAQGTQLISLELDSQLAQETRSRCPRAVVVNEDAQKVREVIERFGHTACDSIVSCIPWANISPSRQRDMLDAVDSVLRSGGSFVTFAYVHSARLPNARHFYRELCARYPGVETSDVIWANVPPAVVYRVTKV
ncbi:MAG: methyltransferase domain-containing protein [Granulosicoccus sp.]|nr:methyltransferase domain-containing protein [Granulosicoccus sp.]